VIARVLVAVTAAAVLVGAELDRRPDLAARLAAARAMAEADPRPGHDRLLATGTTELARRLAAGDLASARSLARHLSALAPRVATVPALADLEAALDHALRTRGIVLVLDDVALSLDKGPNERLPLGERRVTYHALAHADLDRRYCTASDAELDLVLGEIARETRLDVGARLVAWVGRLGQERAAPWLARIAQDDARAYDARSAALEGLARLDVGRPVKVTALALEPLVVNDASPVAALALDACVRLHHGEAAAAMRRLAAGLERQAALALRARVDHYANEQRRAASRLLAEERPLEALFAARPLRMLAPGVPPVLEARCRALAGDPAGAARLLFPFDDEAATAGLVAALSTLPWSAVRSVVDDLADERARARWATVRLRLPHPEARRDP